MDKEFIAKRLVINKNPSETRIALLENNVLAEIFIEQCKERSILGNIYKGIVTRVLPGMQSAFVDIGLERTAFLFGGDVIDPKEVLERKSQFKVADSDHPEIKPKTKVPIESVLRTGQEILVQIAKEPLGTKGARVTMSITLPGRFLVYLPQFNNLSISKKIEDEQEKNRLKSLVQEIKEPNAGVIIRTAAMQAKSSHFKKDLDFLQRTWNRIDGKARRIKGPALIHQDLDLIERITRDLYSDDIQQIIIDCHKTFRQLKSFLGATIPGAAKKLEFYKGEIPLFDFLQIEPQIKAALRKRVDLPSGGYLVIEQTEALASIDVNTGSFVGQHNADDTIFKTNLEAVNKIVEQIRVRKLGGIIILDLIDMEIEEHKERIHSALSEELKKDRHRPHISKINDLGLVEMTRKRTSDSLERQLLDVCPYCEGRGRTVSIQALAHEILREIERYVKLTSNKKIMINARDDLIEWIMESEADWLEGMCARLKVEVEFRSKGPPVGSLGQPMYEIFTLY